MDFNQLNQNPMLRKGMNKILGILFLCFVLEIGTFVGVSYLIGFSYAFWITIGFIMVGYAIRPGAPAKKGLIGGFSPRKLASTLLMIPGFWTDIAAVVVLISPLRRWIQRKIMQKMLPPGVADMFNGDLMNNLNRNLNLDGMNPDFSNFNDFQSKTETAEERKAAKKKRRKKNRTQTDEVIDVDYDIEYDGKNVAKKTGDSKNKAETAGRTSNSPKAIEAEVLDVEYEWEDKT